MTRHDAREQAFMVLFEKIFDKEATLGEIAAKAEESDLIKINAFAKSLLEKAEANADAIDELIDGNTVGWSLDRLARVSLAVMRLAVTEIKFCDETPVGVAVNEAVLIAKKYGTPEDAAYINGVLGTIAKA